MDTFKKLLKDMAAVFFWMAYIGAGVWQIKQGLDMLKQYE